MAPRCMPCLPRTNSWATISNPTALVVRVSGPTATVHLGGRDIEASLPPRILGGPIVAGDRVELTGDSDSARIREILPRTTLLSRGDFGARNRARPLVANADLLIVIAAVVDPPFQPRFLDRYLAAGELGGLECAIAFTKNDLPHDIAQIANAVEMYEQIGYPVLAGSTFDPRFIDALRDLIDGRIAVFAGHSGVGKSSLTSSLTGVARAVGTVSKVGAGRHTTTDPRMIPLPDGGAIVDTAGVRTFYLPPMEVGELVHGFPEIAAMATKCRFRGCRHLGEMGCAVDGAVRPERLESYRRLLEIV